jgi:hypothetical protein
VRAIPMSGSTLYEQLKAVLSGCGVGHHAIAPRCGDTAGCLRSATS